MPSTGRATNGLGRVYRSVLYVRQPANGYRQNRNWSGCNQPRLRPAGHGGGAQFRGFPRGSGLAARLSGTAVGRRAADWCARSLAGAAACANCPKGSLAWGLVRSDGAWLLAGGPHRWMAGPRAARAVLRRDGRTGSVWHGDLRSAASGEGPLSCSSPNGKPFPIPSEGPPRSCLCSRC